MASNKRKDYPGSATSNYLSEDEYIKINGVLIRQPDADGFKQSWETTYTKDSGRIMSGKAELDPMFTVENISAKWTNLYHGEVSKILKLILPTAGKSSFTLHYYSWYYDAWRDDEFYVGKGSIDVNQLFGDYTKATELSCNLIGVNPLNGAL